MYVYYTYILIVAIHIYVPCRSHCILCTIKFSAVDVKIYSIISENIQGISRHTCVAIH